MSLSSIEPLRPITLYRGFPDRNTHVWSPFVNKLEFHLRVANIPYTYEEGSPRSAPNGKIPYVDVAPLLHQNQRQHDRKQPSSEDRDHDLKPHLLGDSSSILHFLTTHTHTTSLNTALSPTDRLTDLSIASLFEDKLYFLSAREKWFENYYVQRDKVLGGMPWLVRWAVGLIILRKTRQTLHLQGAGRYSDEETKEKIEDVWRGVEGVLAQRRRERRGKGGDEPFWILGGERPTDADATVYGFVSSVLVCRSCPRSTRLVRGLEATMEYARRIHDVYFADYDMWET